MQTSKILPLAIEDLTLSLSRVETDQLIIICDKNIDLIYTPLIEDFKKIKKKDVFYWCGLTGEQNKTFDNYLSCIKDLFSHGIHRNAHLVAIGGGALSDFAGFVAATALRGINWSIIPTSLLAQVDASIGGKTALNLAQGKNLIGNLHFPQHIFLCQDFLSTLEEEEHQSGLGEVVKYGLLSSEIFSSITNNKPLKDIIFQCSQYKQKIIAKDPTEKNIRKHLNLGHTFGHIYETLTKSPHGISVLWGIEYINQHFLQNKLKKPYQLLLDHLNLSPHFFKVDQLDIFERLKYDKKRTSKNNIQLVLLEKVGKPYLENFDINQHITKSIKKTPLLVEKKSSIKQSLSIPGSKSYAARALIRASLEKKPVRLDNIPRAKDTQTLIQCLKDIGLIIHQETVVNSFPDCETPSGTPIEIQTGDGGTTNRFLIPFLALGQNEYHLYPDGQMKTRPMEEFGKYLPSFEQRNHYFRIKGPHLPKTIKPDCQLTTQFASAFALSGYETVTSGEQSPYLQMTQAIINSQDHHYLIKPDWSSASFFIVFAALAGEVQVKELQDQDPCQADSSILSVLDQVGAIYTFSRHGLSVKKHLNRPFRHDCSQCPDLFAPLVFLASYLDGASVLSGLKKLPYKESHRLEECLSLMDNFHITYSLKGDSLSIDGRKADQIKRSILTAPDHRIIMTAYLFLRFNGGGELYQTEKVGKSFPGFFDLTKHW